MAVFCVTYDLNKSGQNYSALYDEIKLSSGWCHALDSVWLISTTENAKQLSDRLRKKIDDNDDLLVIKVTRDYAGWLDKATWDWINKHVTN
ncbi:MULTISPECIES: hypothetical protein [unclassified Pseudoalteromonas]|jgi:hypothetical protein|uniref:hypothetical protein n=1 Tax=unclassified Pseudoalteromonas TaxID=194690 RepID=UPI0025B61AE8|nr:MULTISPECIES: hypothetical protein [unclassified Pseudoalteromonas]MDN3412952.1 hypothetical protein [Pseudoalteromonas sp. APC 3250]MDN3486927.1 hypothetical protein [Pseudoalteromonas sp. APC 3224]